MHQTFILIHNSKIRNSCVHFPPTWNTQPTSKTKFFAHSFIFKTRAMILKNKKGKPKEEVRKAWMLCGEATPHF